MEAKTKALISTMTQGYPVPQGRDIKMMFAAFEIGCNEAQVPDAAAQEAVTRFLGKKVERKNRTFCPSVEEFIDEARKVEELQRLRSLPPMQAIEQQDERPYTPPTPEGKAKVAEMVEAFKRGNVIGGDV